MKKMASTRPSRLGTLRSSGPDRRPRDPWDLWTLQALWPDAAYEEMYDLRQQRISMLAKEREAFARLWAGDQKFLAPGRRFLAENPSLRHGLTISFHQGPYPLLVEPFLAAGLNPVILLNPSARDSFQKRVIKLGKILQHKGHVEWIGVGDKGFIRKLMVALRGDAPVIAFLDGNSGETGMDGTLRDGLLYSLPGRDIRVRTGLARLACRMGFPVHLAALNWDEKMEVDWEGRTDFRWQQHDDPEQVTRFLFDWIFSGVMARPEQWDFWPMLNQTSACFSPGLMDTGRVPTGLREDFIHAFEICLDRSPASARLHLERQVEIWPGGVLADLSEDRFFPAEGLRDEDLAKLRQKARSLEELREEHGASWVKFHALRLCLLGLARLGA